MPQKSLSVPVLPALSLPTRLRMGKMGTGGRRVVRFEQAGPTAWRRQQAGPTRRRRALVGGGGKENKGRPRQGEGRRVLQPTHSSFIWDHWRASMNGGGKGVCSRQVCEVWRCCTACWRWWARRLAGRRCLSAKTLCRNVLTLCQPQSRTYAEELLLNR